MQYLKAENEPQILKLMRSQLISGKLSNLDFYLPQLCYLVITKPDLVKQQTQCID